ncbi:uncharacterized protein LOC144548162 [Carex rostrata]
MCYFSPNFILLLLLIQAFLANCCIEHERDALLEFKAGVNDKSSRISSWRGEKCCNWAGIRCNNRTSRVVKLNLRNTNVEPVIDYYDGTIEYWKYHPGLTGKVSPSLLFLSDLKHLDLSFNNFSGDKFPEFISAFRKLKYLNLSNTGLSGMIHPHLGNLSKLLYFDLRQDYYFSDFTLSADTWWLSNMRSLKYIDMSGVDFKDSNNWVQSLNKLSSLEVLVLSHNYLTQIPNTLTLVNFTSLRVLHLFDQNFNTTIPNWMGSLHNLNVLILESCNLVGPYPVTLRNLTNLVQLDLSFNNLNGLLSETHLTGLSKLKYLDLGDTNITILFGSEWTPSFQLNSIGLSSNKLGPKFPSWIRRQVQIENLDLTDNEIDDCIPNWVWSLSSLRSLSLSTNILRGKLPASLVHMTKLEFMDLSNNQFVGKIPFLPTSLWYLDLSINSLSGQLRKNFKSPNKNKLIVSNNHTAEVVELFPCGLISLQYLDLSSNSLSGHLPPCWSNISSRVTLANNRLSGVVPRSLSCSVELQVVSLENNSLTGEFPFDLQFCKGLQVLDLGENNFHGIIPDWVGESFQWLHFLRLHSNLFYGNIPSKLTQLNNLQFLDLANNNLSGPLPRGLNNFTLMSQLLLYEGENDTVKLNAIMKGLILEYNNADISYLKSMDLSNNNLTGEIPQEIVFLIALVNLNLSHNHLIGNIPLKIGNMTSLESLDFHMNNLSGTIPQSMSALYSLEVLNFSYNNLSESIPTGHQLQALDDPSIYSGNPYLCGPPLKTSCGSSEILPQSDGHNDSNLKKVGDIDKWLYLFMEFGFLAGFLLVFFILLLKVKLRYTYFQMVDIVLDSCKC